jgi:N-acetylmuramoyl-L-alanine amidase
VIAPLLSVLLAVAQPTPSPRPLVVRPTPDVEHAVPVETRSAGEPYVRADRLAEALGGRVERPATGRVRLRLAGATFDFIADAPFTRVGEETVPLTVAPEADGERLWIPLQFVTDVLPREARGVLYDAERRELRAFAEVAKATPPQRRQEPRAQTSKLRAPAPVEASPRGERLPPLVGGRRAHVVVVDAGHGGPDTGMNGPLSGGPEVVEKDVTLGIARRVRDALRTRGVTVVMTRTADTLVALADRGRIANQEHGELFVSIHVNAANPAWRDAAAARGFETYFLADAKSEDARQVAARENESIRFETASSSVKEDPLGFILSDMAQNEHLRESSRFATLVQKRLIKVHPGPSRGVKQAGFKVLVTASMPAVLVEVGYGTNAADAAYITSDAGQRAIAGAIADAAQEYLGRSERVGATAGGSR